MTSWSKEPPSAKGHYYTRDRHGVRVAFLGTAFVCDADTEIGPRIPSPDELEALEMCYEVAERIALSEAHAEDCHNVGARQACDCGLNKAKRAVKLINKARGER